MEIDMTLVGEVMSRMTSRRNLSNIFRLDVDQQEVLNVLTTNYIEVVGLRGFQAQFDNETMSNLKQIVEILTNPVYPGIWLYGNVGNGKTTMLKAISRTIQHFRETKDYSQVEPYDRPDSMFVTAKQIWETSYRKTQYDPGFVRKAEWQRMEEIPILFIDDLGQEPKEANTTNVTNTPMADLLTTRYATFKFVVVSSNLLPGQIIHKYDDRVADRCKEMFHVIKYTAPSYRGRGIPLKPL